MQLQSSSPAPHRGRECGSLLDRVADDKTAVCQRLRLHNWNNAHGGGEVHGMSSWGDNQTYNTASEPLLSFGYLLWRFQRPRQRDINYLHGVSLQEKFITKVAYKSIRRPDYMRTHTNIVHTSTFQRNFVGNESTGYQQMISVWYGVGHVRF